jgi:hypothetical protein
MPALVPTTVARRAGILDLARFDGTIPRPTAQ